MSLTKKKARTNAIVSVAVALVALLFFALMRNSGPATAPGNQAIDAEGASAASANVSGGRTAGDPLAPGSKQAVNASPPKSALLDRNATTASGAPAANIPEDLPEDLRRQLSTPPAELPDDLKAQLNAPPPELPEDIKKALATPPRIVTLEEVNTPPDQREAERAAEPAAPEVEPEVEKAE